MLSKYCCIKNGSSVGVGSINDKTNIALPFPNRLCDVSFLSFNLKFYFDAEPSTPCTCMFLSEFLWFRHFFSAAAPPPPSAQPGQHFLLAMVLQSILMPLLSFWCFWMWPIFRCNTIICSKWPVKLDITQHPPTVAAFTLHRSQEKQFQAIKVFVLRNIYTIPSLILYTLITNALKTSTCHSFRLSLRFYGKYVFFFCMLFLFCETSI